VVLPNPYRRPGPGASRLQGNWATPRCPILTAKEDASPYLIILAGATKAIDLATPSGRDVVLTAIEQARASHADMAALSTIILGVTDAAARGELEALMASPKFHSTFVDGLLQQGEENGAVKSKIEDLIKVIRARGLELTQGQLHLVTSCADLSQLATWFDQALDAKTADEIFGAH
jgi:hypothetical protein